jgi:hypothetical protein
MKIVLNMNKPFKWIIMVLFKTDIIYLCYNISMSVVNEIEVLETDVCECNEKCKRVKCISIYDAIMSWLKLIYDLIFMCRKKKN